MSDEPEIIGVDMASGKDHSVVVFTTHRNLDRQEIKRLRD